jgi:crotonobetainyl-CoA:carnitine CoA-transferase CaiB-like acyl-CoA transferase
MKFLSRKNRWQRLLEPVTGAAPSRGVVKSGLLTAGTMAGLTVVSAVVSAVRHSRDDR